MIERDIFIAANDSVIGLDELIHKIASILKLSTIVERESSNYYSGQYFTANLGNSKIRLYYLDTEGLEQYRFILSIEPSNQDQIHNIASMLCNAGFNCFVPFGSWYHQSWQGEGKSYIL
jgi:hypothetical protein